MVEMLRLSLSPSSATGSNQPPQHARHTWKLFQSDRQSTAFRHHRHRHYSNMTPTRPATVCTDAVGPTGASGLTIAALPGELLTRCLAPLSQEERLQHAALVSKRFRVACLAPQLMHSITVRLDSRQVLLPRMRSLLIFLMAHAVHVRELKLDTSPPVNHALSEVEHQEFAALVCSCLSACGAVGCLEQLTIGRVVPLLTLDWLPGLTALQRLELGHLYRTLQLPPGFSRLCALWDADLAGSPLQLEGALPDGLTRLHLEDIQSQQLPSQILQLSNLACLELYCTGYEAASLAALSSLASLRRLSLCETARIPPCLSILTQLDCLVCSYSDGRGDAVALAAALPHLSQLTCLVIKSDHLESPPPSITRLTRLQRLYFFSEAALESPMPPGEWLTSLQWLGVPWEALQASVGALQAAQRLEYLSSLSVPLLGDHESGSGCWQACWDFIATHPLLRCFCIDVDCFDSDAPTWALLDALVDLNCCRPALLVRRTSRPGGCTFSEDLLKLIDSPARPG